VNLIAVISIVASLLCLGLGTAVLTLNRKPLLNKLFFLTTVTGFIYAFSIVMMWISPNYETAYIWHKVGAMWPVFAAFVLNFALVFTQSKFLKNKLNYLFLYVPAVSLWLISLVTDAITAPPVIKYWGYNDLPGTSLLYPLSELWATLLPIAAFLVCLRYYLRAKEPAQKQSGLLVTIGFAIPILTYTIANVAAGLQFDLPNVGIFATLFCSVFVGYAIQKYELFEIDASLAAENIIATIPDSLILTNIDGRILKVNQNLVSRSGFTEKEIVGRYLMEFCCPPEAYVNLLEDLKNYGSLKDREVMVQTKKGEPRLVLFSGSVILSRSCRPLGLTIVIHDISERKAMEERLVKAERQASIGELAGQLGHDLRNPLAGIKNGLYLIKKKGSQISDGERSDILRIIDTAVEDSDRIVTSLIDYSAELRLLYEPCSSKVLVANALSKVEVPSHIAIETNVEAFTVYVDASRMEGVLASVIQNAIQAIHDKKGAIQISSALRDDVVELSIADSGVGIPPDLLPKIFSPLVTTKAKGMGMSLAICKRVVEAHGGWVHVESEVGRGTKVTVSLPLKLSL
jgi:PAS domain S-box-containing protein